MSLTHGISPVFPSIFYFQSLQLCPPLSMFLHPEVGCDTLGTDLLSPFKNTLLCLIHRAPRGPQAGPAPRVS